MSSKNLAKNLATKNLQVKNLCKKNPASPAAAGCYCGAGGLLSQQGVDAAHVGCRVFGQPTFGQQGLVEQDVGQVVKLR